MLDKLSLLFKGGVRGFWRSHSVGSPQKLNLSFLSFSFFYIGFIIVVIESVSIIMEKRINKKLETYITDFKDSIRNKINELNLDDKVAQNDLLEFVYDYQRLVLSKDDMIKRKRIKNSIPINNRCSAKRANGEQCTRRKKDDGDFCGTHVKGTPHGFLQTNGEIPEDTLHKVEVVAEEIFGIVYYIDDANNVYKTEDIMQDKPNPDIIAKYVRQNGRITVPELGLV
jgi:hypothetical protein